LEPEGWLYVTNTLADPCSVSAAAHSDTAARHAFPNTVAKPCSVSATAHSDTAESGHTLTNTLADGYVTVVMSPECMPYSCAAHEQPCATCCGPEPTSDAWQSGTPVPLPPANCEGILC
jgi:hypothetical protein